MHRDNTFQIDLIWIIPQRLCKTCHVMSFTGVVANACASGKRLFHINVDVCGLQ